MDKPKNGQVIRFKIKDESVVEILYNWKMEWYYGEYDAEFDKVHSAYCTVYFDNISEWHP